MKRKFKKLANGELSTRVKQRANGKYYHKLRCCNCGLVHLMQYEITRQGMAFRAWRE